MTINFKLLDLLRNGRSEHENHLIDGLVAGRVSRREFLRFGSVLGLSLPYMGAITGAVGLNTAISGRALAQTPGGTIRVGQIVPAGGLLGRTGDTGRSTGPHLHYEIRLDGDAIDPMRYIRAGSELSPLL